MTCAGSGASGTRTPSSISDSRSRRQGPAKPITRRAPDARAHAADFHRPCRSSATSCRSRPQTARRGPGPREPGQPRRRRRRWPGTRRGCASTSGRAGGLDDPVHLEPALPQRRRHRQRVHHVADGGQPHEERLHPAASRSEQPCACRAPWRRRRSRPGRRTTAPPRARAPSPACSRCPCSGRRGAGRGSARVTSSSREHHDVIDVAQGGHQHARGRLPACTGRPSPFSRRTEASPLTPTTSTSASARAPWR